MNRSKSSRRWLKRQAEDPYVKQARIEGYRSRAVYKLQEIDQRNRLFRAGMTVVDLGAAPGGWSQFAAPLVGKSGRIVASDILDMDPLEGVTFVKGDFREDDVLQQIVEQLPQGHADLVISDMAPNISGLDVVDQPRAMYLAELALQLARDTLRSGGGFLVKLFQGEGFDDYVREVRKMFGSVAVRKPKASRPSSREVYLVARNYEL